MHFSLTPDQLRIQSLCRDLATDFATRAASHDRDASAPVENYEALRQAGLFGLTIPKELGGWGAGLLGYALAAEELAQGCAATAMSFNMHCVVVQTLTTAAPLSLATRQRVADLVITEQKLIAALLSEPGTTNLLYSTRACSTQARRVPGGYTLTGTKAFATMVEAADYAAIFAHPEEVANPESAITALVPVTATGLRIEPVWDTLGMRATRSDNVMLDNCFVPAAMVFDDLLIPSVGDFLATNESAINLPYTAVYLGVGLAVLRAIAENVRERQPKGYAQPLAYHPDIRRRVAKMSAELEAARWLLRYAAWLADQEGQTPAAQAAYFQAKYVVGEAVAAATRSALEIGGAHALFKGSAIERLFRDGATATIMQPSSDVCLAELSLYQLDLDRSAAPPPLTRVES
ncbi:MAG TPA: acyl-CoA dehydrogenase family protein [Candidatus Binatia bacterium]|nr:acyl-CoA dehydrogenase family protein [Candidatus Binatia bacterium]